MIWNLAGVFIIGLCTGAFGYLLRKLSKNRLPKWIIPIAAGGGMFAYLAYYDYAWFDFKRSQLPEGSVVIQEYREPDFFRPWSYLAPSVNQFDVVDGQYRRHQQEGDTIVEYIVYRFIKDPRSACCKFTRCSTAPAASAWRCPIRPTAPSSQARRWKWCWPATGCCKRPAGKDCQ